MNIRAFQNNSSVRVHWRTPGDSRSRDNSQRDSALTWRDSAARAGGGYDEVQAARGATARSTRVNESQREVGAPAGLAT